MLSEIEKQELGEKLVKREVIECISQTISMAFEKDTEEILEALESCENYKEDPELGDYPEIFEFWSVTDWLGEKLKQKGEIVFKYLDFTVWGRQCTGQSISLDPVIQEIAIETFKK
jgi:hypothetical protein